MSEQERTQSMGEFKDNAVDLEKSRSETEESQPARAPPVRNLKGVFKFGVEKRGILPVPFDQRIDPQFSKTFFVWLSANFNILSFSEGTLGPLVYGLSFRDSALTILFFNLLCIVLPSYLATWGPKLGLRQLCQARYSFGYFGAIIPSVLNLSTMMGFSILNCILGGSTLASVTGGSLSWTVGIVIIAVLSLVISFFGYKVLNIYERFAWFPVLVVYLVALGVGGKYLKVAPPPTVPATAGSILGFAATIAGFVITYSPLMSDFTTYFAADVSSVKVFTYTYLGFLIPLVPIQILGAAFGAAIPAVPSWNSAYDGGNIGGLLEAILSPAGGFGKFLTVVLALSVTANVAPTIYSFCLSFQVFLPVFAGFPRYVFAVVAFAIMTPLSIVGAHKFYDTLINFTSIIGYWASCFGAVVVTEHLVFRRGRFANYDIQAWNKPGQLPLGVAAISASVLSFGLVVPVMDQIWFVGPLAKKIGGDIGFEVAFATTALLYVPLRYVEKRLSSR